MSASPKLRQTSRDKIESICSPKLYKNTSDYVRARD